MNGGPKVKDSGASAGSDTEYVTAEVEEGSNVALSLSGGQ